MLDIRQRIVWGNLHASKTPVNLKLTAQHVASVLVILGIIVGFAGSVNHHYLITYGANGSTIGEILDQFYTNVFVDFVGFGITILVIDKLNKREIEKRYRSNLQRESRSGVNDVAIRAIEELRSIGALQSGELMGKYFSRGNLRGADFSRAELSGTDFSNAELMNANFNLANLRGAKFHSAFITEALFQTADLTDAEFSFQTAKDANFTHAELTNAIFMGVDLSLARNLELDQLILAKSLFRSVLPHIGHYDGRFRMESDLDGISKLGFDPLIPEQVAQYYEVSLANYLAGQKWADENLVQARTRALTMVGLRADMRNAFLSGRVWIDPLTGEQSIAVK